MDALNIYNTNYSGAVITNVDIDGDVISTTSQATSFYNDAYNGSANFTFRANNVTGEYSGISINNSSHNSANNNHDNAVITDILLTGILRLLQDRASR